MKRIKEVFIVFTCLLMWAALLSGWTYTYDIATPLGSDAPSVLDDRDREIKAAVQERMNIDHYWPLTGTQVSDADAGKHRQVTFRASISAPTQVTDEAHSYMHGDDLWYQNDTDSAIQITNGAGIEYQSISDVNSNTYIVAVDNAGTGTVNLIKADANDLAVIPDQSETATNAAPVCTKAIANKKYVDDEIAAKVFGDWVDKSADYAAQQATTDGFLVGHILGAASKYIYIYTDGNADPTTLRTRCYTYPNYYGSFFCPVKKDDYWKIVAINSPTFSVYWIPAGS